MKIAVTYEDGQIFQHFGHTQQFKVYDIQDNKVLVKLRGKCSGCKNSHLTLKAFVESTLRDTVDKNIEVVEV